MNRKLRNRHRIMTIALAVIVPALFLAGLAVRPDIPETPTLPGSKPTQAATPLLTVIDGTDVEFGLIMSGESLTAIVFDASADARGLGNADVLVYWTASHPRAQPEPADDAYLLGTLAPAQKRAYPLPAAAASKPGYLSFYSLAAKTMLWVEPDGALSLERSMETRAETQ